MTKKILILISTAVVSLIVLASFLNVVGVHTVEQSNNKVIKDEIDQKELLFQTIVDITNDKEVQSIILKYHSGLFHKDVQTRVLTMKQLISMYFVGSILSKRVDRSKVQSMVQNYTLKNQELLNEISSMIENNVTLNMEMEQLELFNCGCEVNEPINESYPPVICAMLWALSIGPYMLYLITLILFHVELKLMYIIWTTLVYIGSILNCPWI